ncbi:MAG: alpha/beta hydrolase [Phenylobacterium sp.]
MRRLKAWALAVGLLLACGAGACAAQPIPLWPQGAPGSEHQAGAERVRITDLGEHVVSNIHVPSITAYLPDPAKATGAAVIVAPGGGYRELWMDHEGYRVAQWLQDRGIAAFVLKYRLPAQEDSPYTVEGAALPDIQRAIRLVRSRAGDWNLDPGRIGVLGFSAGGNLAVLAGTRPGGGPPDAADPIDRLSARPAFMALIYPSIPAGLTLTKDTPPAFLLCGEEDSPAISQGLAEFYLALRRAGGSAELHVLTGAGHGFGVRDSNSPAVSGWLSRFQEWLDARGLLRSR